MKMKDTFFTFLLLFIIGTSTTFSQSQNNDNKKIESLIAKKRAYNKTFGFGYRIQLYNGSESRAKQIRAKFRVVHNDVRTYLRFDSPEWKVQVGNYKNKLEADRALLTFKDGFSSAIVIPLKK